MIRAKSYGRHLWQYARVIALLWAIEIIDRVFFNSGLEIYGIHPRQFDHWEGLIFAPLLHGSWSHLIGNSISLIVLGAAILTRGWQDLIKASWASALTAGLLVFFVGSANSVHIGASSVIYGYFGFLIAAGIYQRTFSSIFLATLVIIFYHGAIYTMFPSDLAKAGGISWEGHLGGAIGGFLIGRRKPKKKTASHQPTFTR